MTFSSEYFGEVAGDGFISDASMIDRYLELSAQKAAGTRLSGEEADELKALREHEMLPRAILGVIGPSDDYAQMHQQILELDDRVYPYADCVNRRLGERLSTADYIKACRCGSDQDNKRLYALLIRYKGQGDNIHCKVIAVINAFFQTAPTNESGLVSPKDITGNVNDILITPSARMAEDPNTVVFYTISSYGDGAGRKLIQEMHSNLKAEGYVLSTLSPMPGFDFDKSLGIHSLKCETVAYLLSRQGNVQKFHMGNGAGIGDVKIHMGPDGHLVPMVNYIYPNEDHVLEANAILFRQGSLVMEPHLMDMVEFDSGAPQIVMPDNAVGAARILSDEYSRKFDFGG